MELRIVKRKISIPVQGKEINGGLCQIIEKEVLQFWAPLDYEKWEMAWHDVPIVDEESDDD